MSTLALASRYRRSPATGARWRHADEVVRVLVIVGSITALTVAYSSVGDRYFVEPRLHTPFVLALALASGLLGLVGWMDYAESRSSRSFLLAAAFAMLALIYAPHAFLVPAPMAGAGGMGPGMDRVHLFFAPLSRLAFAMVLLAAVADVQIPALGRRPLRVAAAWMVGGAVVTAAAVDLLVASAWMTSLLAAHPEVLNLVEALALGLQLIAVAWIGRLWWRSRARFVLSLAIAVASSSLGGLLFVTSSPWQGRWWIAHVSLLAGAAMILAAAAEGHQRRGTFGGILSFDGLSPLAAHIVEGVGDGLAIHDDEGHLVAWNRSAVEISGWQADQADRRFPRGGPPGLLDLGEGRWVDVRHFRLRQYARTFDVTLFTDARDRVALEQRMRDLTLLLHSAELLSGTRAVEVIIAQTITSAVDAAGRRPGVSAGLLQTVAGELTRMAGDGAYTEAAISTFPAGEHPGIGLAIRQARAVAWHARDASGALRAWLEREGIRSGASVPVRSTQGLFAILEVASPEDEGFSPEQLLLLTGVAHIAGLAISNAQAFAQEHEWGERMARLDRAKSDFLKLVSHDLRNPLTPIAAYLSLAREGRLGAIPEQLEAVLPSLSQKVREMDDLINSLLEAARLEDGRMRLLAAPLDLSTLVGAVVAATAADADPGHRLILEVPPSPVPVVGDAARLRAACQNLVGNAVKYSPRGGEVRCRVEVRDRVATVAVSDQGVGIDAEGLPQLFNLFSRISRPETGAIPGTGLGLYLAREIARAHGGDVTVVSAPGAGSTFTISLPLAAEDAPPRPVGAPDRPGLAGTRSRA